MPKIKKWFYEDFLKRDWEDIKYQVYDLYFEEKDNEEEDEDDDL